MQGISSIVRHLAGPPDSGVQLGAVSRFAVPGLLPSLIIVILALAYANDYKLPGVEEEYSTQYLFHSWIIILFSFYVSFLLNCTVYISAKDARNVLGAEHIEKEE